MATGLFGKLPLAGDFLARGLGPGQRARVDQWLTRHLGAFSAHPERWPAQGLMALLEGTRDDVLLLLVVPSVDAAGRAFPLAAVSAVASVAQDAAERWGGKVLPHLDRAVAGEVGAEELAAALAPLAPEGGGAALRPPLVWAPGRIPRGPEALERLVSSG